VAEIHTGIFHGSVFRSNRSIISYFQIVHVTYTVPHQLKQKGKVMKHFRISFIVTAFCLAAAGWWGYRNAGWPAR
jgi:hypothetical protein